jgi:hypothetical protein
VTNAAPDVPDFPPPPDDDEATGKPAGDQEPDDGKKPRKSVAAQLVELALDEYQLGMSDEEEPYGVRAAQPHIAMLLRGGRTGLRAELARRYFDQTGAVAAQQALADATNVLEGLAAQEQPTRLFQRVAADSPNAYVDLGDTDGTVIEIGPTGWQLTNTAPVVFARTKLTAPAPRPVPGGNLADLWDFVNIAEEDRPVLLAVMVQALIQIDVPHPVLALFAEQGSAKSSTARVLVDLLDPSAVPLRQAPRDADSWVTAAAGSWVVALDNLSGLPGWLSDSLCRASTGDGNVKRALYSDAGLAVVKFRRVVIVNGIDVGALAGDLADRTVVVDLLRIPRAQRREESELNLAWSKYRPAIYGALLDLAANVLRRLPEVRLDESPRMADFARVLAAVDAQLGTQGMGRYTARAGRLAEDSLTSDSFIAHMVATRYTADGRTSGEVLDDLTPDSKEWRRPRDWPKNARAVTGLLRRHAPALRATGWTVEDDKGNNHRNRLQWFIGPMSGEKEGKTDSQDSRHSQQAADQHEQSESGASQSEPADSQHSRSNSRASQRASHASQAVTHDSQPEATKPAGQSPGASVASVASVICGQSQVLAPPGGVTANTPGQTDPVEQALALAQAQAQAATAPMCQHCGEPIDPRRAPDDCEAGFHTDRTPCGQAYRRSKSAAS